MSSFFSDSAIGMGDIDSGGSIWQPLMDQEVISIRGSSSKNTCHDASNSETSSSEKLRVSRYTGGGISHLRGRAWPSAASPARELVQVTLILPPSASGGAKRSDGDVRASPRVRHSHSVGSSLSPPSVASYEWVKDDVLK